MKLKGAIFDMDGTILDSMPLWRTRGSEFLRMNGLAPEPDIDKKFKAMSLAQSAEYFSRHCGVPGTIPEICARINSCVEVGYRTVPPKPGVPEFLEYLRRGGVRMRIATATERYLVEGVLRRTGLLDFFDGIMTCGEVGHGKDYPDIFLRSMELLGTDMDNTAVFEDAIHAIRTAKRAGYFVAGVEDASYKDEAAEIRRLCDVYITDFHRLVGAFDMA